MNLPYLSTHLACNNILQVCRKPILLNIAKFSGAESKSTVPKFRKRERKFLFCVHQLHKRTREIKKFHAGRKRACCCFANITGGVFFILFILCVLVIVSVVFIVVIQNFCYHGNHGNVISHFPSLLFAVCNIVRKAS